VTAVPEPATITVLIAVAALVQLRRNRHEIL